jgi:hypothetical protein
MHQDRIERTVRVVDGVKDGYQHYAKRITPRDGLDLPGVRLKWYDIGFLDFPVTDALHSEAREVICHEIETGMFDAIGETGFIVLHDCGEVVFLMIGTWRGNNELWETVYQKFPDAGGTFRPQRAIGDHRPTYCVWELGAVTHESLAWARYLRTERTEADFEAYLTDQYQGEI